MYALIEIIASRYDYYLYHTESIGLSVLLEAEAALQALKDRTTPSRQNTEELLRVNLPCV